MYTISWTSRTSNAFHLLIKPQAFFHAFNGQEAQIRFIPILRQHVGDANPWSLKDVGQEYGDFWLPVHSFFLLSMYPLIMFTLADALYTVFFHIMSFIYLRFSYYHLVSDFPIIFF